MNGRKYSLIIFLTFCLILYPAQGKEFVLAAGQITQRTLDMMILIDNSCSMFPSNKILAGCTTWGSDINYLRIRGADLFFARLGFSEANEADYQVGVISFGDAPVLISPLKPLKDARDSLAGAIANPTAQSATLLVPALKMAYTELRQSPAKKTTNLPTVVLITDGVPWPVEGQSETDIEKLLQENTDIPLFIMLLKNTLERGGDYDQYVQFWIKMQTQFNNVFVYPIEDASQIEETYNTIISQLQNSVPASNSNISQQKQMRFYVSQYVKKIVITVMHHSNTVKGEVSIQDPSGKLILEGEAGVQHFHGDENPVEVYAIEKPRLVETLQENYWTIQSDQTVDIFINYQGRYSFNFLSPETIPSEISNIYKLPGRVPYKQEFGLRFNLILDNGTIITQPQRITGEIILPDDRRATLPALQQLTPNAAGDYELQLDFTNVDPGIVNHEGGFSLLLKAGPTSGTEVDQNPIASVRLVSDIGLAPYFQSITPKTIECTLGQASPLKVTVGDYQTAAAGTIKASVNANQTETLLKGNDIGEFNGDLRQICEPLIRALPCSNQSNVSFNIKILCELKDLHYIQTTEYNLPVRLIAPQCTPEPVLPQPQPTSPTIFTSVSDQDQDGLPDEQDACPDVYGWSIFKGCPPGSGFWTLLLIFAVGILGTFSYYGYTQIRVRTMPTPPEVYVAAIRRGKIILELVNVRELGIKHHTNEIRIGSDPKKALIQINGLMPVEFAIQEQKEKVFLVDAKTGTPKGTFRHLVPEQILTSNPEITLWIGSNLKFLKEEIGRS